ncbi:hypothetical protein [Parachitinimonas caeni]|uniref:Solute-binding protein family 3/N-terminal domain-containing protein n=1 Tax=Parachitinimonas caeni TaxID=3031301 RepID=A0ABT7DZ71_9NEIS|nr:hypothetical protein [Parachitinimonas caeni]MDK2125357.1 hypothetical protein [Parachitinimonas caeni]
MRFVFPAPEGTGDKRYEYYWDLMKEVLEATRPNWGDYKLEKHPMVMNAQRVTHELQQGGEPNILVRTTNRELESTLQPVRIPLDKGLTGYRVFLTMQQTLPKLASVDSLDSLKKFSIGQEVRWADVEILKVAGFNVVTGEGYQGLFGMLGANRFDLFSRGVNEVVAEHEANKLKVPGLTIEPKLLLYYPLPRYYFVSKTAQGLQMAKRIEEGLRLLIKSGAFDKRYKAHKQHLLSGLSLSGRKVFRINNATLPPNTPLDEKALWDDLQEELK